MQHTRSIRRAAITAVAVGSLAAVVACSSGANASAPKSPTAKPGKGKTLVVSTGTMSVPALAAVAQAVKGVASAQGYKVVIQDANNDAQTQVQQLETAIDTGQADAIYAIMVDPQSSAPVLAEAKKKHVAVLTNGIPSEYGLKGMQVGVTFDYNNSEAGAAREGTLLGQCIKKKLGGKAEVIEATDVPGIPGAAQQEAAAEKALAKTAPGAKIVTKVQVGLDRAQAQTDMSSALQGNPGANAVMGNIDEAAYGAIGAYQAAGKQLPCLVSQGGTPESEADVKSGAIYALVEINFGADVANSMKAIDAMVKKPKAKGKQLKTPFKILRAGQ